MTDVTPHDRHGIAVVHRTLAWFGVFLFLLGLYRYTRGTEVWHLISASGLGLFVIVVLVGRWLGLGARHPDA